jgi:hypothetical protein
MARTVQQALDLANPNDLPARLAQLYDANEDLGLGALLGALRIRPARQRTSLTNQVSHVHDEAPASIHMVFVTAGTPLAMIQGAAPDAGEVRVEIDADTGVPTFTFAAATTSYWIVSGGPLPQTLAAALAREV